MSFYAKELKALHKSGRFRSREVVNESLLDFASNDYLGLADKNFLHKETCKKIDTLKSHSSKASMLVNGYHQVHKDFEDALCKANDFAAGIVIGSGFNANIALIESLVRKDDALFMDELYHASGLLATNLSSVDVTFFKHNDMNELRTLLKNSDAKRKIVAVEGIYSMSGDLCPKEVFEICDASNSLLLVDEAHSSGVVGSKLMGVFDLYDIKIQENHIKMGTLGKAYGSFGAFILCSEHIAEYLINRAKPIIYATSLSLYDTQLAHESLKYILSHKEQLKKEIVARQVIIQEELGIVVDSLIAPVVIGSNSKVLEIKDTLLKLGYSVGAIRQPTVKSAIIRVIARLGQSQDSLRILCQNLAKIK